MKNDGVSSDVLADISTLPLPWQREPGDFASTAGGALYVLYQVDGARSWISVGGGGSVNNQVIVGPGAQVVSPTSDVVTVDPQGGAVTLSLPALSARTAGRALTIIQVGTGTVAVNAAGADLFYAGTSAYVLAVRNDSITLSPQTSGWRITAQEGAPQTFTAWVSSTGSDTAVGTLAAPLATVGEAMRRSATVRWRTTAVITVLNALSAFPTVLNPPEGLGSVSTPLRILGTQTQAATGTVLSSVAGTASTPMTVTVAGTPWTASQFAGFTLRFTSGALNGQTTGIFDNTTSTLTTFKQATGTPAPGDTFQILANPIITGTTCEIRDGSLALENLAFSLTTMNAVSASVSFLAVSYVGFGVFFDPASYFSTQLGAYGFYAVSTTPGVSSGLLDVPRGQFNRVGVRSMSVQSFRDSITVFGFLATGLSRFAMVGSSTSFNGVFSAGVTVAGGTHFLDAIGGYTSITNASISNTVGGSAISIVNGNGNISVTVGTGNAAPAVQGRSSGTIQVVSPNVGVTIAAGGSDVKVGANANISWATLAAGGNTAITDFATANTEGVRIGL